MLIFSNMYVDHTYYIASIFLSRNMIEQLLNIVSKYILLSQNWESGPTKIEEESIAVAF